MVCSHVLLTHFYVISILFGHNFDIMVMYARIQTGDKTSLIKSDVDMLRDFIIVAKPIKHHLIKKHLLEIESEWNIHKKIIDISSKKGGIRK